MPIHLLTDVEKSCETDGVAVARTRRGGKLKQFPPSVYPQLPFTQNFRFHYQFPETNMPKSAGFIHAKLINSTAHTSQNHKHVYIRNIHTHIEYT